MAFKVAKNLEPGEVLIGESGGESMIYDLKLSSAMPGLLAVETEHGMTYLDPDNEYQVADK